MSNKSLTKRDLSVLWHPCTQMKDHAHLPLIPIKKGDGVWLEDFDGNRYIDAISSWWVNLFGHGNPTINQAICSQLDNLEHVLLAGFTHEPVIQLSEQLVELTPKGLTRCFYADNGSSAIEVAMKMSYHYWRNCGEHGKTRFITLTNSYHGETLGALAVGNVDLYKQTYGPLLMDTISVTSPDCFHKMPDVSAKEHAEQLFKEMEQTLQTHHHEVCAVVIEPLVQCAGNMRMYHPVYLELLREACDRYNVHLIVDEIAVGFGRTGTLFASEQANICPDFMCLSKGLTGGYLPLSVTLTTDQVYDAFFDDYQSMRAFLHSHSYTGNPLGCAAALATLKIFQEEQIIEKNRLLINSMGRHTAGFIEHPHIGDVRQRGMILAIEMVKNKDTLEPFPWQERRGLKVYKFALKNGVLLRPLGNVIYFMPPYVINDEQIATISRVAWEGIQQATRS
ncbi:MAG: adenosylmethionine--8-amino-7-oxononanoate transaminase [Gammaproteobacteria bacterium]